MKKLTRRIFLFSGLAAGGLAVWAMTPFSTLDRARRLAGKDGEAMMTAWARIAPDNTLTVIVPHSEMGQGVHTALPMMLADELDADWATVRMEQAPADKAFANYLLGRAYLRGDMTIPRFLSGTADFATRKLAEAMNLQITGGSTAVRMTGQEGFRRVGAAMRQLLVAAAASEWNVPEGEIEAKLSRLTHKGSGKTATYGDMAAKASSFEFPGEPVLKTKTQYAIMGTSKPRFDVPAKVTGAARYGADIRLPGLLFAAVASAPVFGGSLTSVDEAPALKLRGVKSVVKLKDCVAVVADNSWRAREALAALSPQWNDGTNGGVSSESILAAMKTALDKGGLETDHEDGDADAAVAAAPEKIEAAYSVPYLAHACMEPINCTAWMENGTLRVWGAFQDGLGARVAAAKEAGLSIDQVELNHAFMGGGFGRKAFTLDYMTKAIGIAKAVNAPVQVQFSREEDMRGGFYRNASIARMKAGLKDGRITGWIHNFAERHDPPEATMINYAVPARAARYAKDLNPITWGPWRSVDHTMHGFFIESFMDEAAHAAKEDPLAFRLKHLGNSPRHAAVLEAAAQMANWTGPREQGRALGIAMREAFGTIVAQVAEVSVGADGRVKVHSLWSAADAGEVVDPKNFTAQIEGGAIYGLCAALYGQITIDKGRAVEGNFDTYEVSRMADSPRQAVRIIESDAKMGGAGEPGTAPVAAAVANAVFALTGQRIRELPLKNFDLRTGAKLARL
jgi:isoquinoline 1-oxidoreductase beta subunit